MRRLTIAVVLAVVGAAGMSGCRLQPNDYTLPGQVAVGDDGYTVTVQFDQVENLVPNSTVLHDNVVIGTVADIDVEDWQAQVRLRLLDDVPVPADAVFSIGQKTLLGAQYVEVADPPAAPQRPGRGTAAAAGARTQPDGRTLRDGDVVPVTQTGTYPATEQVLGAVALLLNNGGLSQISTITSELSTALDGRVPDTRALVRRTDELLGVLDRNRAEVVTALESLDTLSSGLAADREQLGQAVDSIAPGLRALEEERTRLVRAVTATGRTGDQAVQVIRASRETLLANLDSLGPILTNLGKVSEQLPEALKIGLTMPFPAMTTTNAVKGDYANLFTTLDLSTAGLAESWLGGLPPAVQAGDPVQDPLTPAPRPDRRRAGSGGAGGGAGDDGDAAGGEPTGGGSGSPSESPSSSCLLGLLGDC
jgi:phospholipid/cholesterol/gamma-HCH transport system substrate-binding protein